MQRSGSGDRDPRLVLALGVPPAAVAHDRPVTTQVQTRAIQFATGCGTDVAWLQSWEVGMTLQLVGGTGEDARVTAHLVGAERFARNGETALDRVRARNRRILLGELGAYRREGRFPRNHEFRGKRVPYFIDPHGTRCALAHLLEIGGQRELVEQIAKTRNNAHVHELAGDVELRAWLDAAGLTLEEAARIQPSYCFLTVADVCLCNRSGTGTVALGTVVVGEGTGGVSVRIERLAGDTSTVSVGDVVLASVTDVALGDKVILQESAGESSINFFQVNTLVGGKDGFTCNHDEFTSSHPLSFETAAEALRSKKDACQEMLIKRDQRWGDSQCADRDAGDDPGIVANNGGCSLGGQGAGADAAALASLAIFAALIRHRARRRAWRK
jgi:hypothetical protein